MDNNIDKNVFIHSTVESGYDFHIKDQWGKEYHFKISSFPVPSGLASEAVEIRNDDSPGYRFNIHSDFNTTPEIAEERLIIKIERGINRCHLKRRNMKWEIGDRDLLRGRIEWNDNYSGTEFDRVFVIDGQKITIEEFVAMLEPFEGWHFNFKILDQCDDDT